MERVKGIEPSSSAWEAAALPLSYTRLSHLLLLGPCVVIKQHRTYSELFETQALLLFVCIPN